MTGFKPLTASDIYAEHGIDPKDSAVIAAHLKIVDRNKQYSSADAEKIIGFAAEAKAQKLTIPRFIQALEPETVGTRPNPPGRSNQTDSDASYEQTTQDIHDRVSEFNQLTRDDEALRIKRKAQVKAANLLTAENLLTAHYLQTGGFDDPELSAQVEQSRAFLETEISSTEGEYALGKLLLATGILELTKPPAIEALKSAESSKFLLTGTPT